MIDIHGCVDTANISLNLQEDLKYCVCMQCWGAASLARRAQKMVRISSLKVVEDEFLLILWESI